MYGKLRRGEREIKGGGLPEEEKENRTGRGGICVR